MNDKAIRSAKLTAAGILDKARARTAITRAGGQIAPSKYLPDVPRQVHAGGGRIHAESGGKMELRSKAAEVVRNQPQAKGNVDQLLAMVAKTKGVKQAELLNAGRPFGDSVSKEELAKHFEDAVPQVHVTKYGDIAPAGHTEDEKKEYNHLSAERLFGKADENQLRRLRELEDKLKTKSDATYGKWSLEGGRNYREHLLHLPPKGADVTHRVTGALPRDFGTEAEAHAYIDQMNRAAEEPGMEAIRDNLRQYPLTYSPEGGFYSSHWSVPNVIAHVRMSDRSNGDVLHVGEVQSDWGQNGREQGFYDPKKPIEVFHTGTGKTVHAADNLDEAKAVAEKLGPQYDYGHQNKEKVPQGPYVGNTQQWTDLALKHVLTEAAKGKYKRVVISPGEANADLYGQRQPISRAYLTAPVGMTDGLGYLYTRDKASGAYLDPIQINDEKELIGHLGRKHAKALLSQEPIVSGGTSDRAISEPDMHLGGHGMVDYYNNIVHPAALKLLQQHDPSIQPEKPYMLPGKDDESGDYKGLSLPMTDKARQSILENGFGAFKRGGTVGKAGGGELDGEPNATEAQAAPARLGNGPQAGGLPDAGGIRGSESVLPAPLSPHGEVDLLGLPKNIMIPKLGIKVVAGHNPEIRQVARSYAQQAGIDYSPPTIYQRVDPDRGTRIAHAYENMAHNPDHPLVKASYEALKQETLAQYQAAKAAGLKMEFYPDPQKDPYHSQPRLMTEDVNKNNHMFVYPTDAGFGTGEQPEGHENNPLLGDSGERWNGKKVTFNDLFRAVHDYYGHVKEGLGFRGDGEENAWRSHAAMYSPLARIALGAETRGQNSLLNYGPHGEHNRSASTEDTIFSPQKLGILPVWAHHEGAEFIKPEERNQMEAIYKQFGVGPEGVVGPDIRKPMSIFPKPQRMFPEGSRPPGGQYLSAHNKADVTGHKAEAATIGIAPGGKPFFHASQNAVEQTGTPGRGSATVKTNLFKQKAGWKWQDVPEGHENTDTIVSVEHRGKHIYALNSHFPRGVDLARYENAPSEPRLRPTTKGSVTLGPQAGSIVVRGKVHPVYHHVIVKADGGAVDAALAITRRFTKDGAGATMALKSKGK